MKKPITVEVEIKGLDEYLEKNRLSKLLHYLRLPEEGNS